MAIVTEPSSAGMTKLESHLLERATPTYTAYYNGKMSYMIAGSEAWKKYIQEQFEGLSGTHTSENIFKTVIDLYAENLMPVPDELRGFSNCLVPLLSRGEAPVVVDSAGLPHFPEHYEMVSDGVFTIAAIFTRSLELMEDYVTYAYSDGRMRLFKKDVPEDLAAAEPTGYVFHEETRGNTLFRFALDDKGFGGSLAALQDRVNHSILDQTVIAEMYARPFWYLLNVDLAPENPYIPKATAADSGAMTEQKTEGASGRIFTTNSDGPFGQLDPPTISDMIAYHDSITDKVSNGSGIPQFYFKPGSGTPPTGVALKVLSKRFNNKISRMRDDLDPEMERLADLLGVEKTVEVKDKKKAKDKPKPVGISADGQPVMPEVTEEDEENVTYEYELWNTNDDLLQESLDAHGISLSQMGYPLGYIAEVVTPGVDLDDYEEDVPPGVNPAVPGQAPDMTATGQTGLPATPGQVQSYAQNPGQRAAGK